MDLLTGCKPTGKVLPATYCTALECEEDEHKEDLLYSVLFLKNFIKAVIILLNSTPAFTILYEAYSIIPKACISLISCSFLFIFYLHLIKTCSTVSISWHASHKPELCFLIIWSVALRLAWPIFNLVYLIKSFQFLWWLILSFYKNVFLFHVSSSFSATYS